MSEKIVAMLVICVIVTVFIAGEDLFSFLKDVIGKKRTAKTFAEWTQVNGFRYDTSSRQ